MKKSRYLCASDKTQSLDCITMWKAKKKPPRVKRGETFDGLGIDATEASECLLHF